jgi:hypothetical protein
LSTSSGEITCNFIRLIPALISAIKETWTISDWEFQIIVTSIRCSFTARLTTLTTFTQNKE